MHIPEFLHFTQHTYHTLCASTSWFLLSHRIQSTHSRGYQLILKRSRSPLTTLFHQHTSTHFTSESKRCSLQYQECGTRAFPIHQPHKLQASASADSPTTPLIAISHSVQRILRSLIRLFALVNTEQILHHSFLISGVHGQIHSPHILFGA